ncbi:Glyoxalase-like domain-containing protein [Halogranum rubrum]|uniref:Glyoxalase-like domain-containing protein n=1 Tax=Halogranum rubrum TaxID=553466 RepID=A0A1I4FDA0_9EURY|nr:VOC family protein [Halogranum rubrum]SFL15443.1 Glyoxalase-like domain-containing protein [Halogranum rubrum]
MSSEAFESSDHEFYPMPLFVQLTVSDLPTSVAWYRDLGFDAVYEMPTMAHLRYRKYADVLLVTDSVPTSSASSDSQSGEDVSRGRGVAVYLTLEGESVDDVAKRAETAGATVVADPHETSWNTRELTVADPDGYEFVFSAVVDADRSFEDVVGSGEQ